MSIRVAVCLIGKYQAEIEGEDPEKIAETIKKLEAALKQEK